MGLNNCKNLQKILFLLPLICDEPDPTFLINKCLEIYNEDTNKPQWESDKIILRYKNGGNIPKVRNYLNNNPYLYAKYTEKTDDFYTIYAFTVPPKFKRDYKNLLEGKYTSCSQAAIAKIKGAWSFSEVISGRISDMFIGLKTRMKNHYPLKDTLNLNQVPIKKV